MGYSVYRNSDRTAPYVTEILADSISDLQTIDKDNTTPGSVCVCLENKSVYILSNEKNWINITPSFNSDNSK